MTKDKLPFDEEHKLGLGLTARVEYEYVPPIDPPPTGAEWDEERDRPGVRATLTLPGGGGGALHPALRAGVQVLGEPLEELWGTPSELASARRRTVEAREATLRASLADVRAQIATALQQVRGVVGARAARLARREAVIAKAEAE